MAYKQPPGRGPINKYGPLQEKGLIEIDINPFDKESRDKRRNRRARKGKGISHCGNKGQCAPKSNKLGTGKKLGVVGAGTGVGLDYVNFYNKHAKPNQVQHPSGVGTTSAPKGQNKGMFKKYLKTRGKQFIDFITG